MDQSTGNSLNTCSFLYGFIQSDLFNKLADFFGLFGRRALFAIVFNTTFFVHGGYVYYFYSIFHCSGLLHSFSVALNPFCFLFKNCRKIIFLLVLARVPVVIFIFFQAGLMCWVVISSKFTVKNQCNNVYGVALFVVAVWYDQSKDFHCSRSLRLR